MEISPEPREVRGFRFAGVVAGLKQQVGRKDLGLIVADRPVSAAGLFTTNEVKAAPVIVTRERIAGGRLQAVIANSGSANCFTGRAGVKLARDSCAAAARELSCPARLVAPCSTGVIGHLYDLGKFGAGLSRAVAELSVRGLNSFAEAIMTTDTVPKLASTTFKMKESLVTIAGAAKGAGMLSPKMATLLAFIVTDAALPAPQLKASLRRAVRNSFNAITVDGDMSTNDTLLLLASGAAGNAKPGSRDAATFEEGLTGIAESLARQLVRDGEGATKLVTIKVRGARSVNDAERIARRIANSPLVKTAFFGCDPNVGRITAAAGAAGVKIEPNRLDLMINDVKIAAGGMIMLGALEAAAAVMRQREFSVALNLKLGKSDAEVVTSDLSHDYVRINAEYTT